MIARIAALFVLLSLAAAMATGALERAVLYPFDPRHVEAPDGLTETHLATADGAELVVWSARARPGKPVVLYFCGNAGNLAAREGRFHALTQRGFGLVAAGYRGSSGSTGKPSEATLTGDAQLLAKEVPALVGDGAVVYYGESLGSAVAIALAVEQPPAALVLEAPFSSLSDMATALYGSPGLARLARSHWPSRERIVNVAAPLLILHGAKDQLVPPAQGRALFEAAASPDKRFYEVPGAGHETVWQPEAQRVLYRFLDRF